MLADAYALRVPTSREELRADERQRVLVRRGTNMGSIALLRSKVCVPVPIHACAARSQKPSHGREPQSAKFGRAGIVEPHAARREPPVEKATKVQDVERRANLAEQRY